MTFEQWQATRKENDNLEEMSGYTASGYEYEAGFIVTADDRFHVPIETSERDFATLAEAEQYLWANWCCAEINGKSPA